MRFRLAIPKKHNALAEITDRIEERMYPEVEIQVPVYDIIKALNIEINEHTNGNDILVKINELKSNKFNRIENITDKMTQNGIDYKIVLDTGKSKLVYRFYMGIYALSTGYLAIEHKIEEIKREILNNDGILLNELELKQIKRYLQKHN